MSRNSRIIRVVISLAIITTVMIAFCACGKGGDSAFNSAKSQMQNNQNAASVSKGKDEPVMGEVSAQQAGMISINELLYTDEYDKEYLAPDSDDYEVIVYEVPNVYLMSDYTVYRDAYGVPEGYGLSRSGNEYDTYCTYIKVISYGVGKEVKSVKEKLAYPNEKDALRPIFASYSETWIKFDDGVIPKDFDEEEAVLKIVDESVPTYFSSLSEGASITRKGSVWYGKRTNISGGYYLTDLAGIILKDNGKEFKAKNTNEIGINSFALSYGESSNQMCDVTVYYSEPLYHGKPVGDEVTLDNIGDRLDNPSDFEYFVPTTDDYLYFIRRNEIDLMSFDEDGMVVQWITRETGENYGAMLFDEDAKKYMTLSDDKYVRYNDSLGPAKDYDGLRTSSMCIGRTAKYDYVKDRYDELGYSDDTVYLIMSKGLTKKDTEVTNCDNPLFEDMKKVVPAGVNDFILAETESPASPNWIRAHFPSPRNLPCAS